MIIPADKVVASTSTPEPDAEVLKALRIVSSTLANNAGSRSKRGRESPDVEVPTTQNKRIRISTTATARSRAKPSLHHHTIRFVEAESNRGVLQVALGALQMSHDTPLWKQTCFTLADIDVQILLSLKVDGRATLASLLDNGFHMESMDGQVLKPTPMQHMLLDWLSQEIAGGGIHHTLRLRNSGLYVD
jgi:hypothetical protein